MAIFTNPKKTVHFGDNRYQHFKDLTPIKKYSRLNHYDKTRRIAWIKRHTGYTSKSAALKSLNSRSARYLALRYLW